MDKTVRLGPENYTKLERLAQASGMTLREVLDCLVDNGLGNLTNSAKAVANQVEADQAAFPEPTEPRASRIRTNTGQFAFNRANTGPVTLTREDLVAGGGGDNGEDGEDDEEEDGGDLTNGGKLLLAAVAVLTVLAVARRNQVRPVI